MLTTRAILSGIVSGAAAGALTGLLANRFARRGSFPEWKALLIDAVLGAIGFTAGALGIASLPMMETTTVTRTGNMVIRSTAHHYDNAYRLALCVAILLAAIYEFFRTRRLRKRIE